MEITAGKLQSAISRVKESLAGNEYIPILAHFCFTGKQLYAYDGAIATVVPFKSEFGKIGVHGMVLTKCVEGIDATTELSITHDEKRACLALRWKRSMVDLKPMPFSQVDKEHVFKAPDEEPLFGFEMTDEFARAIESVLHSVGIDGTQKEFMHVALVVREDKVSFFSSNNISITHTEVSTDENKARGITIMLSKEFLQRVLALWSMNDKKQVGVAFSGSWAAAHSPKAKVYGKLLALDPPKHAEVIKKMKPEGKWSPIPAGLPLALQRVNAVQAADAKQRATLIADGKRLIVKAVGAAGEVEESFKMAGGGEGEITIIPAHVLSAIEAAKTMCISPKCVGFKSRNYLCLVSVIG